jgi:spore maturation protein CgeB
MILTENKEGTSHHKIKKNNLNVSYISLDHLEYACPEIRVIGPLRKLKDRLDLHMPLVREGGTVKMKKDSLYSSDIILIQRSTFFARSLAQQKSPWRKIVYEIDDLLIDIPDDNPNRKIINKREQIIDSLKEADALTVTTDTLRDNLSIYNKNIYVLPNYIDLDIWGRDVWEPDISKDRLVVGYIGTPTHKKDLNMIFPAIKKIIERYGDKVVFKFWGCITPELLRLRGVDFVSNLVPDYKAFAEYMKGLDIDIALAPLVTNTFNECKSNIKFLEYSVCKIPGIYTRIAPYTDSVTDGETGMLCDDDPVSWYNAMEYLIEHHDQRMKISEHAYREVIAHYTLEANAHKWFDLYSSLIDNDICKLKLIKSKCGNNSLRLERDDGSINTLHSIYDPENEAVNIVNSFQFDGNGILVVLGLGLGYHLKELLSRFPDTEVIAVEDNPEIYKRARQHGVVSQDMEEKVTFIIGYPANEAIKEITKIQINSGMVPLALFVFSHVVSAYPEYYNPILAALKNTASVKLWEKLRYPKFKKEELNILMIDAGYFLVKEVRKACVSLNHKVHNVPIDLEGNGEAIVSSLIEKIVDFKPDFLLTINHLGFDRDGILTSFLKSIDMPLASWYVDSPKLIIEAFNENVSPWISIFLWDKSYIENMEAMGFDSVHYLPLGTDERIFKPLNAKKQIKRMNKYRSDVSFVGNSMVEPVEKWMDNVRDTIRPVVERVSTEFVRTGNIMEFLRDDEKMEINGLSAQEKMDFEAAVIWKATLNYRLACLQGLKKYDLRIYGDKEWERLFDDRVDIRNPVNYYKELPLLYNSCKINFNATSLQMKEAVNQRVFDVPACSAFVLTDYQDSLNELFDMDEVITYKDSEEIPELVTYYLNNPEKRENIALKGRERVLNNHTYKHRLNNMIEFMKERYK